MASWQELRKIFYKLVAARDEGRSMDDSWNEFSAAAQASRATPPYHLRILLHMLGEMDKPRAEIRILDHGCGRGMTCLYLLALGYTQVYGIDVQGPSIRWNDWLAKMFDTAEPRFRHYDGNTIPFEDDAFDVIFSQQVLEHVSPPAFERYYSEEGRTLRSGGRAYHQVPHRLGFYEGHTRTWLIHYLPWSAAKTLYRLIGRATKTSDHQLFLRWPGQHLSMARKHIGATRNLTASRLQEGFKAEYFDGPIALRRLASGLCGMPLMGKAATRLIGAVLMLETISERGKKSA